MGTELKEKRKVIFHSKHHILIWPSALILSRGINLFKLMIQRGNKSEGG